MSKPDFKFFFFFFFFFFFSISSLDDVDIRLPPLDNHWIEVTDKKSLQTIERLDNDLKNYKSNSIKESIR